MNKSPIRILLVEDSLADTALLKEDLSEELVQDVSSLGAALAILQNEEFDIIILDLNLPDSDGLSTVKKMTEQIKAIPIIVMTGLDNQNLGMEAVQLGAQDYLVKGQMDAHLLRRSIQYSIERNNLRKELLQMSIFDDLTGLYNRRGFKTLVEQQVKEARRSKRAIVIFLIDLNKMKTINDSFGHSAGDLALKDTADLLKKSFRETDIIARWGGDEFVVVGVDTSFEYVPKIKQRLENNLLEYNKTSQHEFKLSMSVGEVIKYCDAQSSLEELIEEADKKMYEQKKIVIGG